MMRSIVVGLFFVVLVVNLASCNSNFTPKPRAYFNIELPQRTYQLFNEPGYPYAFEYPSYARISAQEDTIGNTPYWINVDVDQFKGRIYLSYKSIGGKSIYKLKTNAGYKDSVVVNSFEDLREEAYKMTYKHTIKASAIVDSPFVSDYGSSGVYFYVGGEAATSRQFYLTDGVKHFLRGALYFDASPNADSLSMVSDFIETDMRHLIKTFRWK